MERLREIKTRLRRSPAIEPYEVVIVVGLLFGNVLCPQMRGVYHHWSIGAAGSPPVGSFGKPMSQIIFNEVLRNLHFCDNSTRGAVQDRVWKILKAVQVLQRTFLRAWTMTNLVFFDEGFLLSSCRRNPTRSYMPDTPQRWDTKMFMACDAETSYRYR